MMNSKFLFAILAVFMLFAASGCISIIKVLNLKLLNYLLMFGVCLTLEQGLDDLAGWTFSQRADSLDRRSACDPLARVKRRGQGSGSSAGEADRSG